MAIPKIAGGATLKTKYCRASCDRHELQNELESYILNQFILLHVKGITLHSGSPMGRHCHRDAVLSVDLIFISNGLLRYSLPVTPNLQIRKSFSHSERLLSLPNKILYIFLYFHQKYFI